MGAGWLTRRDWAPKAGVTGELVCGQAEPGVDATRHRSNPCDGVGDTSDDHSDSLQMITVTDDSVGMV